MNKLMTEFDKAVDAIKHDNDYIVHYDVYTDAFVFVDMTTQDNIFINLIKNS